jgi:cytochrome c oxidase assembly protein subunit 15
MTDTANTPVPGWLRFWAWLTAALCLPLAIAGAETTTKGVGMVDSKPFRHPLYLFQREEGVPGQPVRFLHLIETGQIGMLIEHSHRFFGVVVGLAAIVLCVGLLAQGSGWRRWLGLAALLAVSAQGLLGYFRVSEISRALAALHGCAAQLVFGFLAATAVVLSRAWDRPAVSAALRWPALGILALLYVQMVFGALLRHLLNPAAQRLHVLLAFAVLVGVLWLARRVRKEEPPGAARLAAHLLAAFVVLQPILGVEAWITRLAAELPDAVPSTFWGDFTRSGHHVLGTVIFALMACLTCLLWRPRGKEVTAAMLHARAMEGARP